jgi:hypothetical protein
VERNRALALFLSTSKKTLNFFPESKIPGETREKKERAKALSFFSLSNFFSPNFGFVFFFFPFFFRMGKERERTGRKKAKELPEELRFLY